MRKKLLSLLLIGLFSFCAMTDGVQAQSAQEIEDIQELIEVYDNKGLTEEADVYREKLFAAYGIEQIVTVQEVQQMELPELIGIFNNETQVSLNNLTSLSDNQMMKAAIRTKVIAIIDNN